MNISQSHSHNQLVITICGEFNGASVIEHRDSLEQLHQQATGAVIFDLSQMHSIDSSGIGFLVYVYKRIKPRNLQMVLLGLHGTPLALFKKLQMDKVLDCRSSAQSQPLVEALS